MRELRPCKVSEIRVGDEFVSEETGSTFWTAREDAHVAATEAVHVSVSFPDGGTSVRLWDSPDFEIGIVREWPEEEIQL